MPYTKYHIQFKDDFGRTVHIYINQEAFFGTPIELSGADNPLTIAYAGDEGDLFQTMISSKATIRLQLQESGSDLFEDLAAMDENTFGVTILVANGIVTDYRWNGWLVPDEQVKNFSYYSQSIELTAIDPISRLKGQKLLNADDTYITGIKSLKFLVERAFEDVFTPENTIGTYSFVIKSKMVLNAASTTVFPDVLEQLAVSAEAFNDDMGRATNTYDVVEKIAKSLFMRCFYENGKIYFVDILDFGIEPTTPKLQVFYKAYSGASLDENIILLGDSENITTTRTYRESRARFSYNGTTGLLRDGHLSSWEPFGGGTRLVEWKYGEIFMLQSDKYNRRVGTGRQESPFGILLKYYPLAVGVNPSEMIFGKSDNTIPGGSLLSLAIKIKCPNQASIPLHDDTYDVDINIPVTTTVIIYNPPAPAYSIVYRRIGNVTDDYYFGWAFVDLTGTSFEDGEWDTSYTIGGVGINAERTSDRQVVSLDLPPTPIDVSGKVFVCVSGIGYPSQLVTAPADATDTIVYEVLLSQKPKNTEKETTKGEITYITRKIRTSQEYLLREIDLNTTVNPTVAGSLSSTMSYELFGDTIPPGTVATMSIAGYGGLLEFGLSILTYSAIAQIWLNYPQYKIDFEVRGRENFFYYGVDLSCFYDPARPSTAIYNSVFAQMTSTYDFKPATRRITAISMKLNERNITDSTLDEDNDLAEFYYIT